MDKERLNILQRRAREMRNNPTEPEKRLWRRLSRSQLGNRKFRRQAVIGNHIADFLCPTLRLIVEIDGETHDGVADANREGQLLAMGYRTIRFTNDDVMRNPDGVLAAIDAFSSAIEKQEMPHPNPSPEGERLESAATALREAAARLEGVSATARLDAELLMAHAAGIERSQLLLRLRDLAAPAGFAALIERRATYEPVAYILGYRDFWSVRIKVAPGVLIPRADSETLIEAGIEAAAAAFGDQGPANILDLGCGPGTLLLASLDQWPSATGVGIERSAVARALAQDNAETFGLADRAEIRAGDWTRADWVAAIGARFDLVLCNPPYVAPDTMLMREVADYEPAEALYAADEGLADYRIILAALPALLSETGVAVIELGAGQAGDVGALADAAGLGWSTRDDLGGHARAMVLKHG